MKIGHCHTRPGEYEFVVWAPFRKKVDIKILEPQEKIFPMQKDERGYWRAKVQALDTSSRYVYVLDDALERPDPASFFQGRGVHGPSQVIDHSAFQWHDGDWRGIPLPEMIIYELHVGTFTAEGSFGAIIPRLKDLLEMGINTIELMPVAQFPGERNWGYDGTYPFAVQNSYGGPRGLKDLVEACHSLGMAVILDVVYNHLGPEGNYFHDYGPYFTEKYKTPWGRALNFDDAYSDDVRNYFIENALYFFDHFHIDGLRLDAVHAINDDSARPFLKELKQKTEEWSHKNNRRAVLIAESDLNDIKIIQSFEQNGFGLDAQWSDDFHHCVHTLLTGENTGYYQDFGTLKHLSESLKESFVYAGKYSRYRKRHHGNCAKEISPDRFIVFIQNHDQTGNRAFGDRLSKLVSFEGLKAAAGVLFFAPYIPLIFMGEEYAEEAPFNYFVSHSDEHLIAAVRSGREKEFASFKWQGQPPDPQAENTFLSSKIKWDSKTAGKHKVMAEYYKTLISLRKTLPSVGNFRRENIDIICFDKQNTLYFRRWNGNDQVVALVNFDKKKQTINIDLPAGRWKKIIDSHDEKWAGGGTLLEKELVSNEAITIGPLNFAVYQKES